MFQFEKISVNQILVFSQILNETSLRKKEFIESEFLRYATNFIETLELLKELGMITVREEEIVLKPKYKMFLSELIKSQKPQQTVKSFIVNSLLVSKASFSDYVYQFLFQFKWGNNHYEFLPSTPQRLKDSGLRNFLIDLEFLYVAPRKVKYVISDDYVFLFSNLKKPHQLAPDELLQVHQKKEEIGKAAELKIIEYEQLRLSGFPHLAEMIKHIALEDVIAGYDIKSFEVELDKAKNFIPRFIEVKAVSPWDYKFYWSRNEIESASQYQKNYYLYLLPIISKNEFDIKGLKIINDPYSNVYENKNEWFRTEELISFSIYKD